MATVDIGYSTAVQKDDLKMDSTLTFHEEQIRKWIPTGWKVVQKYSPGILLGNWYEDNLGKFQRGTYPSSNSTNQDAFRQYCASSYHPDGSIRRKAQLRNDGLDKSHIYSHHGRRYSQNQISSYDQHYNRKHCVGIRQWKLRKVAWLPEASDHPIQGESTKFGLKEEKEKRNKEDEEALRLVEDTNTVYELSYRCQPEGFAAKRYATPRHLSAHFHPHNMHKNLHLRGNPLIVRPEVVDPRLLKLSSTI